MRPLLIVIIGLMQVSVSLAQAPYLLDTIRPASFETCLDQYIIWYAGADGPIFGNNAFGDLEKAQRLSLPTSGNGVVSGAIFWWGYKRIGSNGSLAANVYSVDPLDGSPMDLLASSLPIEMNSIDTSVHHNVFLFSSSPYFDDEFFISLDLSGMAAGDSIAALATEDGCGSGCVVWEKWSSGNWNKVCDTYDFDDLDMIAEAIVDWSGNPTTGLQTNDDNFATQGNLSIFPASPNPSSTAVQLSFALSSVADVQLQVMAVDGRLLRDVQLGKLLQGTHNFDLDVSDLPAGTYFFRIDAGGGRLSSSFSVN